MAASTFGELKTRIRQLVEDTGATLYSDSEITDAANDALDEMATILRKYKDSLITKTSTITFSAGSQFATLPTDFENPLKVTSTQSTRHEFIDFHDAEAYAGCSPEVFFILNNSDGTKQLGRATTDSSFDITLYYNAKFTEITSDTDSFAWFPDKAIKAAMYQAAADLFGSRNRAKQQASFQDRAERIKLAVIEDMSNKKTGPRYVRTEDYDA